MHYEVEQKYPLDDPQRIEAALIAMGALIEPSQMQIDTYFNHPSRNFAQTDEALRIRQIGSQNFVTYKGPKLDETTKTRQELELPLPADVNGATAFAELLKALGFNRVADVRKSRRAMSIPWRGRTVAGALDEVDRLGKFLELEINAGDHQLDEARRTIEEVAAALGLESSERRSYLELLLAR